MKNIWNAYKPSIILLGAMVIGGVVGFFWGEGSSVLQPIADLFLNMLYCCVVPLIFWFPDRICSGNGFDWNDY
ncbi:MAG: hypothetical protein Q4D60_09015 [Eubacteriales bacterium]|nr:hypothetical protein [Eubacteriales bacterium]